MTKIIPYNPKLVPYAKMLRQNMILGEIALGGGLLTVVFVFPVVVTVLLDVLFVTIGSAAIAVATEK